LESNLRKKKTALNAHGDIFAPTDEMFGLGHTNSIASTPIEDDSRGEVSASEDSSVIDQDSPLELLVRNEESSGQNSTCSSKKLTRSPAFKLNKKFNIHETPTGYRRQEVTDEHFYPLSDDEEEAGGVSKQDETGYASLQEEHTMLQQMYDKAIEENDRLKDANTFMQQKLSTLVNMKHYEVFGSVSSSETNPIPVTSDCGKAMMYNKLYYEEMSFDQLNNLPNNSFEIKTRGCDSFDNPSKDISSTLEKKNRCLEAENRDLISERNSFQDQLKEWEKLLEENEKKHKTLEQEMKFAENQKNKLLDQVVYLCSTLDVVKHLEATKRCPVNKDELALLESELFFMIDQNVRYESALMEIKFKVTKHKEKINIDALVNSKSESSQNETTHTDHQKATASNNNTNKTKRNISSRASISRASSPLVKKSREMKKEHREAVKSIRKENSDHPVTLAKEIKACRTSRTKELLQERLLMTQRITNLEEQIVSKDKELEKNILHVELLTKELGQIELESMDTGIGSTDGPNQNHSVSLERQSTFTKDDVNDKKSSGENRKNLTDVSIPLGDDEDIEIIEIPEVKYEDLMAFIQYGKSVSSPLGPGIDTLNKSNRNRLLEREIKSQIVSLERANECLRESNIAVSEELHLVRSMNRDQKDKIKELKFEIATAVSEAQALRYQLNQNQYGFENSKLRYEKQISTMRKQLSQIQTYREKHHTRPVKKLSDKFSQNAGLAGSF